MLISKRNRKLTAPDIREVINKKRLSSPLSVTTIKDRLQEYGLCGRIAARKPLLRLINKQKRLAWAKKYLSWTPEDWRKVLFTDESKFELLGGGKRRCYVRRMKGERMLPQCILSTVKHGGGSVMVWGCFGNGRMGSIKKVEGTLKKEGYHQILMKHAIPSGKRLIGEKFNFQQDNDPKHTSHLCKKYLDNQEEKGTLIRMDHPPQSPDLNPIEILWDELDRRIRKMQPTNLTALWECLQTAWHQIEEETLTKLMNRMPRVCQAVITAKGGYFEESRV